MNRFDNGSVSAYTPQSLQELAFTPLIKRQQHDEISKSLAKLNAIVVDPLSKHRDEAIKLKQDFEKKLENLSGELASKGIDGLGKEAFYKLQKERNDLIAPTGRIGQINDAKIDYNKQKEDFIKNAEQQKIGRDRALQLWNEKTKDYSGYDNNRNILNITPQGVAAHQDYEDDLLKYHSILGKTTNSAKSSGYSIVDSGQGDGSKVMIDRVGNIVHSDNIAQLNEAIKGFSLKWINPTGEGTKYAKDAGLNITANKVLSDFNAMTEKSNIDNRGQQTQYIPGKSSRDGENPNDSSGIIISNDSTLTSDATSKTTYSDAHNEIKRLQSSPSLSPIDKAKLEDLKELRQNADNKLKQNKNYSILDSRFKTEYSKWEKLASKMDLSTQEKEAIKKYPNVLPQILFSLGIGRFKGSKNDPDLKLLMEDKNLSSIYDILNKRQKIKDDVWKESSSLRHNYSYLPSTPKEEGVWNLHNENVYNTLKGIPDLNNVLDLTSVYTTGGTNKNITPEDVKNIQTLLKNGDPKSFKINNVKTYGDNKTPEVTMTFNTNEDAPEFDSKGVKWDDEYGGSKKPVTVTFKLKKFSNSFDTGSAAGYKNLTGAIANFWKDKGGINEITGNFQGAEVYNSMIENTYSNIPDKELYARAQSDADAREALLIRVAKHQAKKQ